MLTYFSSLSRGRAVLWCYLLWYLVTVFFYFDPSPRLWLSSIGISAVIGFALQLSVASASAPRPDRWQTFRLFLMPFCVSSFSSLIKDAGFWLIVPPRPRETVVALAVCGSFIGLVAALKWRRRGSIVSIGT